MRREKTIWPWLKRGANSFGELVDLQRVENLVGIGNADVSGCAWGCGLWVELKDAARPKRADTPVRVKWQPGQQLWLRRRWAAGGGAYVLVRVGGDSHYLVPGPSIDRVGHVPEGVLADLSVVSADCCPADLIRLAVWYRLSELKGEK
jgi:hypothetical protein